VLDVWYPFSEGRLGQLLDTLRVLRSAWVVGTRAHAAHTIAKSLTVDGVNPGLDRIDLISGARAELSDLSRAGRVETLPVGKLMARKQLYHL
jgi:hypothetical protein